MITLLLLGLVDAHVGYAIALAAVQKRDDIDVSAESFTSYMFTLSVAWIEAYSDLTSPQAQALIFDIQNQVSHSSSHSFVLHLFSIPCFLFVHSFVYSVTHSTSVCMPNAVTVVKIEYLMSSICGISPQHLRYYFHEILYQNICI